MEFPLEFTLSTVLIAFILFSFVDCHQTCPKHQYHLSNNVCLPCRNCDNHRIIRQCSPTQDTVCADVLKTRVFHFACDKGELGMFVEGKTTLFLNVTKKQREKTKTETCGDVMKYKKRLLFRRLHHHVNCPNGTYQWVNTTLKDGPQVPDCRPCSGCASGTEVISPCRGEQDTFCSFPRVKNTMQVFNTQCTEQGPNIQVYSSLRPSVPHTRLIRIKIKLFPRLCSSLSKTILVQNDLSILSTGTHANLTYSNNKNADTSTFDENMKENQEPRRKRTHSKRREKQETNKDTEESKGKRIKYERDRKKKRRSKNGEKSYKDDGHERGENKGATTDVMHNKSKSSKKHDKMSDKASDNDKGYRGYKNEQARFDTQQNKSKRGKKSKNRTKIRLCEKKKYRGRGCKQLKKRLNRIRKYGKKPSVQMREYDSKRLYIGYLVDGYPQNTTQPTVTKSVSVLNTSSTMRPSTVNQGTVTYATRPNKEVDLEDMVNTTKSETNDSSLSTTELSVLLSAIGLATFVLILIAILLIAIRRVRGKHCKSDLILKKKYKDHDDHMKPTMFDCFTDIPGSMPTAVKTIKDPLSLKSRSKSQDSGYLTTCSQTSGQGSRTQSREINASPFQIESSACVQDVQLRNAVSTCCVNAKDSHLPTMFNDQLSNDTRGSYDHGGIRSDTSRRSYSLSEDYKSKDTRDTFLRRQSVSFALPPLSQSDTESQYYSDCEGEGSQDSVFVCHSESGHTRRNPSVVEQCVRNHVDQSADYFSSDSEQTSDAGVLDGIIPNKLIQTETALIHIDREPTTCILVGSANEDTSGRSPPSVLFHDDAVSSQETTLVPKSRSPSGDSSSSTVSSTYMHIKFSLKDEVMTGDWLQKANTVGPENFLSTYSCSVTTQTDDWSKSNLKARPIFCASWQDQRSFNATGGTWHLNSSDVILEVPPLAVPYGNYVDISAATFTNLSHLRQVLDLADDELIVGPLPEFDAGPGYQFQQHVRIFLPHCLPFGVPEEHIKLLHIDKNLDGELVIKRLPPKREYGITQKNTNIPTESHQPRLDGEGKDVGYFQFLPDGQLLVATKRFCGFVCTICCKDLPEPQIHLVATAKKQVRSKRSGEQQQINVRLYLWDRKIAIKDFQRDLEGRLVGQQLLHVVDEYHESLMKIAFSIYEDDEDQLWKHAMRPKTTEPIFQPEKIFPFKELLCCHAKDEPKCEEWLIENCAQEISSCHFQCYIDVQNIATNRPSEEAGNALLNREKKVTLFIHDIGSSPTIDVLKEDPPGATEHGNRPCSCQHRIMHEPCTPVSNTPFGKMEQGPSITHETTDVSGWLPLSNEPLLDVDPQWITPASNPDHAVDQIQRIMSCPPSLTHSDNPWARGFETTERKGTSGRRNRQEQNMERWNDWQPEDNENQIQESQGDGNRFVKFGMLQQNIEKSHIAPFGGEPRIGEGARPKICHANTVPLDRKSRKQNIPRPELGRIVQKEQTANALRGFETKSNNQFPAYVQSIEIHGQSSMRILNEVAGVAEGHVSRGEWHGGRLLGNGADGNHGTNSPANQPQTALSDSADHINMLYL